MGRGAREEFLEPGRSAKSVEHRPEFQRLLATIKTRTDIDYVIVDSLSRANRNRLEDAVMVLLLRQSGVSVVSATEPIDETPAGQLLHGILASVHEFRIKSDGNDVRRKMEYKARLGGTPGRAKIGYLNVREQFEGRHVATIAVDDHRAPLVRLAFQMYATGDYTLDSLTDLLQEAGLCALPHGDRPPAPISRSQVARMLRDRYYIGYVRFAGNEYSGRHPHIIDLDLFHAVQDIMDAQSGAGIRQRKHNHYLKGTLWCGRCGRRMVVSVAKGVYEYYMCRGRQTRECDLPYLPIDKVEHAVIEHYATVTFPADIQAAVREQFDADLAANVGTGTQLRDTLTQRLGALSVKEDQYLDLVGDPEWPTDKIRDKITQIRTQREKVTIELGAIDADLGTGRDIFTTALTLMGNPQKLYRTCTTAQRKVSIR